MNDPIALLLQFGFLAVLYLFLFWVARSAMKDLSRQASFDTGPATAGGAVVGGAPTIAGAPRLVVVAALGLDPGTEIDLGETSTLGRAPGAEVRIQDNFASAAHARIYQQGEGMVIEDLGSTNGTYLNGRQLRKIVALKPGDTVRIGDTELRYQE